MCNIIKAVWALVLSSATNCSNFLTMLNNWMPQGDHSAMAHLINGLVRVITKNTIGPSASGSQFTCASLAGSPIRQKVKNQPQADIFYTRFLNRIFPKECRCHQHLTLFKRSPFVGEGGGVSTYLQCGVISDRRIAQAISCVNRSCVLFYMMRFAQVGQLGFRYGTSISLHVARIIGG